MTPFFVVRRQSRRGDEFLSFSFQDFKGWESYSLWRSWTRTEGVGNAATFQLEGQEFMALDGGPQFRFAPAISFFVNCETQPEVHELWEKLSEGGKKDRRG
jgi:predicted 3-demethylubiquinone-9 3-methyltransferase (glyoxalase superfamily)